MRRSPLMQALAWCVLALLVLPAFIVIPISLTPNRYLSLPTDGISLQHWESLLTNPIWREGIWLSLFIALTSTGLAVAAGTLCSIGCWRLGSGATKVVRAAMIVPLMVPTIAYALGLYRLYVEFRLVGSTIGVVMAHTVTALPYVALTVTAALANLDPRLEQAARGLGASTSQTLWRVILPNLKLGIASGAVFAFIHSWDELLIVIFVGGRNLFTLPRLMWDGINENLDPTIAAVASAMILITLVALLLDMAIRARRDANS
ncbi:ABC transporter permease [Roseomonas fluvialis]|nr:ABC transporter permease [Roseomonas fluvialis]